MMPILALRWILNCRSVSDSQQKTTATPKHQCLLGARTCSYSMWTNFGNIQERHKPNRRRHTISVVYYSITTGRKDFVFKATNEIKLPEEAIRRNTNRNTNAMPFISMNSFAKASLSSSIYFPFGNKHSSYPHCSAHWKLILYHIRSALAQEINWD